MVVLQKLSRKLPYKPRVLAVTSPNFPSPGRNTQVVNVGSNLSTAEHYYIHINAKEVDYEEQ